MRLMNTLMPPLPADAPQALHKAMPHRESFSSTPLSATRIGWLADFDGYLAMEPGVLDLCQASLAHLGALAVRVEAVQPRFDMAELWHYWLTLRNLSRVRLRGFADARPVGMQIMGPFEADGDVFTFAAAYEAVTNFLSRRPVLTDSSGVATR